MHGRHLSQCNILSRADLDFSILDYILGRECVSLLTSRPRPLVLLFDPALTEVPRSSMPGSRAPWLLPMYHALPLCTKSELLPGRIHHGREGKKHSGMGVKMNKCPLCHPDSKST